MSSFRNKLGRKILSKILFLMLIIFFLVTLAFFANIFFSKSNFEQSSISNKVVKQINNQVAPKQSINEIASSSAKQATPSVPKSVISGNQLKVPVLYYHYVGNNPNPADLQRNALSISPDKFEEQMKYLKDNGFTTISYDTLYAALRKQATLPSKPVLLTFDDGYIDFYYNAYNVIKNYGLSATVFIPTGLVGQPAYLTWNMIQEMYASGAINFGAHSVHHIHLASVSPDVALAELSESKKDLQDHLGLNINYMAYPYGETSSSLVSLVQKVGYVGAIGTWSNKIQSEGTIYNSPRLRISGSIDIASFANMLQ